VGVLADVDAVGAQARLGDRRVGGLHVRRGRLMPGAVGRTPQAREPPRRGLRALALSCAPFIDSITAPTRRP
jgi:hypothetical protein